MEVNIADLTWSSFVYPNGRVAQIINNTNFGEINNLVGQGRDIDYIARRYHMDLAPGLGPRHHRYSDDNENERVSQASQ